VINNKIILKFLGHSPISIYKGKQIMKFIIIDLSTGQRLHESLFKDKAVAKLHNLAAQYCNIGLFYAKSNGHIMGKLL